MKWMIQGATIMTQDDDDRWLENGDIAVDGERILAIGHRLPEDSLGVEKVIDGRNKLVMPGLINAHHHSHDRFDKGRLDNLPLEVWQVVYNSPLGRRDWTPMECYLRTILNGMEMLKIGTTTVIDDVIHGVPPLKENIDAVFQAYQDLGMRALVSSYYSDKPFAHTIPYLENLLPDRLKSDLALIPRVSPDEMIKIWQHYGENWRDRVRFIISPSAPQRCTDDFLKKTWKLSNDLDIPVTVHVSLPPAPRTPWFARACGLAGPGAAKAQGHQREAGGRTARVRGQGQDASACGRAQQRQPGFRARRQRRGHRRQRLHPHHRLSSDRGGYDRSHHR